MTSHNRWILHVDLDQFIAAVEVLRHPELRGRPVVVGGDGDPAKRGVVATASYEAREHGVHSGLPMRTAARRSPDAVFLPTDRPAYEAASAEVMSALRALGYDKGVMSSHGFRAMASSLLNECGKWNPDAIERALAHAPKDEVRGVYNRSPYWAERVLMAQWWSDQLDALRDGAEIVPLARRA